MGELVDFNYKIKIMNIEKYLRDLLANNNND